MDSNLVSHKGQERHSQSGAGTNDVKLLTNQTTDIVDITITTTLVLAAEQAVLHP
jgi:hypothetical protein